MDDERFKGVEYVGLDKQSALPPRSRFTWGDTRTRRVAGAVAAMLLLATALNLGVWLWTPNGPRDALDEEWNECGRSSQEAMRRGCVMEPLFYGWMPRQCVYQELTDRYPVFENRKWYLEQDRINEVAPASLWNGSHIKIYTHVYHDQHCLFQWRKLMYAMDHNQPYIDNKTISFHHSGHCADQLQGGREGEDAVNEVELGFYRCRNTLWASGKRSSF